MGSGRFKKVLRRLSNQIINLSKTSDHLNAKQIRDEIEEKTNINLSRSTITRILRTDEIRSYSAFYKPKSTKKHVLKRLEIAQTYLK